MKNAARSIANKQYPRYCQGLPQHAWSALLNELAQWDIPSVAAAADVSDQTMYYWLSGKTRSPRMITVVKVSRVLGFELDLVKLSPTQRRANLRVVK